MMLMPYYGLCVYIIIGCCACVLGPFIDASPTLPHAILGPACSSPAVLTASLTSSYLNTVQISYAADTPQLTDVGEHPLFFQSVPSYSTYKDTIYAIMRKFDWLNVGVIHAVVPYYTLALEQFVNQLQHYMMDARVVATQGLDSHLLLAETIDAKIFIGMVPETDAANMLCAAYHQGTTGPSYQWILLGDFEEDWWKNVGSSKRKFNKRSCTQDQMLQAVESALILTHNLQIMQQDVATVSGRTVEDFWIEYVRHFITSVGMEFQYDHAFRVPSTYDAVWSIALALNETMPLFERNKNMNFTSNSLNLIKTPLDEAPLALSLKESLERINFTGVSGKIRFSPQSHSQLPPTTNISQMESGRMVSIGIHDPETDTVNLSYFGNDLVWQGIGPPRDRPQVHRQNVSLWLVGIILGLTVIGLLFALAMFVMNFYYRKHKVIKASSPYINMIIIAGCVLGFCSIIVMSIESIDTHQYISPSAYPLLCNIRPWLLSCGFTLAFGALFAKTWRLYMIFRNPWKKNRPYKDHILIAMVCAFLLFDVILLILWATLDPLMLSLVVIGRNQASFIQEQHAVCAPSNGVSTRFVIWISVISLPKGVLLFFGTFLVTQSAKIKTKFFNDARYTAIAIYGVVIGCLTGMPTAILSMYKFEEDLGYADTTTIILACCYLILIMVFIPKLVLLKRYKTKIPTAVLLNINPSFRIRKYHTKKSRSMPKKCTSTATQVHSENDLGVGSNNSSRVRLCEATNEDTVDITTLSLHDWETAKEDSSDNQQDIETHGEELVKYGDISYIAYVSYTLDDSEKSFQENNVNGELGIDDSIEVNNGNHANSTNLNGKQRTVLFHKDGMTIYSV